MEEKLEKERERESCMGQIKPWDVDARLPASDAKDRVLRRATTNSATSRFVVFFYVFNDAANMRCHLLRENKFSFSFFSLLSGPARNRFDCFQIASLEENASNGSSSGATFGPLVQLPKGVENGNG